ncbi:MAG: protease modulator HflC [Acidobacteriota bacterium]|nr:protease modulator HflC [Acidobacteriota bacterium]
MKLLPIIAVVVLVLIVGSQSFYYINEWQQVIITQFGKPIGEPHTAPGLKFKVPFIQEVRRFDRRFLEWSGDAEELPTKDKVFIWVDVYARWRISDPLKFLERLRDESRAQSRLDDILDGGTRNAVANHELIEVIRSTNRAPAVDEAQPEITATLAEISNGRDIIRREILEAAQVSVAEADLGIEILDVRFRRINYGETVRPDVYNRMISERRRIADRFRSEGQGEAANILGEMDRELKRIQSEAYREAQEIHGKADAEATEIYASAYNQSADSRRFYEFLKTMETFRSTVDKETSLILSTDGDFYRYLKGGGP